MNDNQSTAEANPVEPVRVEAADFVDVIEKKDTGLYWTFDIARDPKPYRGAKIDGKGILVEEFQAKHEVLMWLEKGTKPAEPSVRYEPPMSDEWASVLPQPPAPTNGNEPHWTEGLRQEAHRPATAVAQQATAAAVAVADTLVPEFGNVLAKYEPGALAFGFPPAVDALITKAKLSPEQTDHLLKQFRDLFVLSTNMRGKVQTIQIFSVDDTEAIAEAKECHRILRDERLNAEKRKKAIKEPYLRPSQLIDGVFRIWMDEIGPIEKEALAKAQYAENLEKERKEGLRIERTEKLKLFDADGGAFSLGEIDDNAFELIYQGAIAAYNAKKAETARIEQERMDRERAAEAERQRLREENARLTRERAEEAAKNAELQRIADEQRKAREEMEAEAKRREETRLAEERRLAAIEEQKRLAPEKEKLRTFFDEIVQASTKRPELESEAAKILLEQFVDGLAELVNGYAKKADQLGTN